MVQASLGGCADGRADRHGRWWSAGVAAARLWLRRVAAECHSRAATATSGSTAGCASNGSATSPQLESSRESSGSACHTVLEPTRTASGHSATCRITSRQHCETRQSRGDPTDERWLEQFSFKRFNPEQQRDRQTECCATNYSAT